MEEIVAIPWNGFNAISTFSGCGGSSLGYKMAGFKVLWASEFIPAAQDTYRANYPNTILDTRDIRQVQSQEILDVIGLNVGELDLLDGSPPCASFSTAGKREKGWGKVKAYSDTKQRVDDLFFEYVRLVDGLQPKVFVAENVSGLVKGTAKGYFLEILAALKGCGYNVKVKLLDAQWLGVPQMRQRVFFVGVRNDIGLEPAYPKPLPYQYSVRDAIPWIVKIEGANGFNNHAYQDANSPHATVQQSRALSVEVHVGTHKGLRSLDDPAPTVLTHGNQHTFSEMMLTARAYLDKRGAYDKDGDITDQPAPTVLSGSVGTHWIVEPESSIEGYAIGVAWDTLHEGEQSEKYYQLVKASQDNPSPTITQRGGDNTAASVTHPTEKRKFSIAELKRICAFPDNFILTGTYAQQWERLGRAVPPVMMYHLASTIRDKILCKIQS